MTGKDAGPTKRRTRLRDPAAIQARAKAMYRLRLRGFSMREVAAEHGLTTRHARREIAALPDNDRRCVERVWRDDLLRPGAWELLR